MTKKDLIKKLNEIASKSDQLAADLKTVYRDAADIFTLIENLPIEADEIEDDEEDDEDEDEKDPDKDGE